MNHLENIVLNVKQYGSHEEEWFALINAYFRGDDCFLKIKQWAAGVGLEVSFDDHRKTCLFYPKQDQAKASPPAQ